MTPITVHSLATLRGFVRIVHHVPGRLRVRLAPAALQRRADGVSVEELCRRIESIEGVRRLRISPTTLSAVVEYDSDVLRPRLWDSLIDGPEDALRLALEALTTSTRTA